jgi:hypothetical protein
MSKSYDKYRVKVSQDLPVKSYDKYRIQSQKQEEGDSWGALLGKSALKGLGSIADLPNLAAQGIEGLSRGQAESERRKMALMGYPGSDIETPQINTLSSRIPTYSGARQYIKERTGFDLEPKPRTGGQRVASHAAEFAGSLGPWGWFGKGAGALNAAKLARTGAAIGATSGALQEGGVDPLVADLGSAFALPTAARGISSSIKGTGNLLNRFTKSGQEKAIKSAASDILKEKVGEKNIPRVLENLNAPTPFNTKLNTAELAQNTGISGLHRALAPNIPAIAEKEAITDSIINRQLNQLSPQIGLEPTQQGEAIRNYLFGELKNRKQARTNVTEPLYQEVNKLKQGIDLPNTQAFLKREGEFAKGDIKNNLNYVEDIIRSNAVSKGEARGFDKLYGNLGQGARSKLQKEVLGQPVPAELTNALKDISGRIGAAKKSGNNEVVRALSEAKSNILADMAQIPEEAIARSAYAKLSKPVSAIEKEPLLGKIVKQDTFGQEFLTSPEQIPDMILRGSLNNTKALMAEVGKDKKTIDIIRGSVVDKLLNTSELASANALGQQNLSYNKVNNFLKKHKGKLQYIFDENQVKVLDDVKSVLKRRNMVATVGRAVGSNTQSQTTLLENLTNPVKQSIGKKIINKIPGGKYLTPVYELSKNYEKQQITRLLEQALLEPDMAKLLLTPVSSIKNEASLKSILTKVGIPTTAYSLNSQRQREEK